jgi:hypothetical protein
MQDSHPTLVFLTTLRIIPTCRYLRKSSADDYLRPQQALVMRVPNTNRKSTTHHLSFEIEDAEHLHSMGRDRVLFIDYSDMAKA